MVLETPGFIRFTLDYMNGQSRCRRGISYSRKVPVEYIGLISCVALTCLLNYLVSGNRLCAALAGAEIIRKLTAKAR